MTCVAVKKKPPLLLLPFPTLYTSVSFTVFETNNFGAVLHIFFKVLWECSSDAFDSESAIPNLFPHKILIGHRLVFLSNRHQLDNLRDKTFHHQNFLYSHQSIQQQKLCNGIFHFPRLFIWNNSACKDWKVCWHNHKK